MNISRVLLAKEFKSKFKSKSKPKPKRRCLHLDYRSEPQPQSQPQSPIPPLKSTATTRTATEASLFYSFIRKPHRSRPQLSNSLTMMLSPSITQSLPLPYLLYQRQISNSASTFSVRSNCNFNYRTMVNTFMTEKVHSDGKKRKRNSQSPPDQSNNNHCLQWKQCMKRKMLFTQLNTPLSDAVLGLDSTGSYLISVGDGRRMISTTAGMGTTTAIIDANIDNQQQEQQQHQYASIVGSYPSLSIRFYAVTSPALVECTNRSSESYLQQNTITGNMNINTNSGNRSRSRRGYRGSSSSSISPHVLTIPLALESLNQIGRVDRDIDSTLSTTLSVSNTRIQILLSRDGAIGVSFIHHTTGEDASSSIVLFNQPSGMSFSFGCQQQQQQQQLLRVCRCSRIRIGGGTSHTLRNLLWPTKIIPNKYHHENDESLLSSSSLSTSHTKCHIEKTKYDGDHDEKYFLCRSCRLTHGGYVLFNDEDDGYRIFWITTTTSENNDNDCTEATSYQSNDNNICLLSPKKEFQFKTKPQRVDIIEPCMDDAFEEMYVDPRNGYTVIPPSSSLPSLGHKPKKSPFHNTCGGGVRVKFEAYLHVDALLSDIIHRRRKIMFGDSGNDDQNRKSNFYHMNLPDFYYNIVSFNSSSGRSVNLVVTFANPRRQQESNDYQRNTKDKTNSNTMKVNTSITSPAAYALFVEIDLFDQSYSEGGWVQHPSKSGSTFLRQWSNQLAVHKRMAKTRMGPFCVSNDLAEKIKCLNSNLGVKSFECSNNHSNDYDNDNDGIYNEMDDVNPELWEPFVRLKLRQQQQQRVGMRVEAVGPPKEIAMSSLYKFCDLITNDAVVNGTPVSHLSSRDFPLQICYGV
mmetsp:Transcript_26000/g.38945  ORF Transcript_26000/g.38945 Transcript_26000/m.38945 type:complete len:856 (+) Transcript_26000:523-3090(+)